MLLHVIARSASAHGATADFLRAVRVDALGHAVAALRLQGAQTVVQDVTGQMTFHCCEHLRADS